MLTNNSFTKVINRVVIDRLFRDSVWSLFGNVLGKGLALVAGIFIARFLGSEPFGEYGIVKNTIVTIGMLSTFGLGYTSTKFIAENRNARPAILRSIVNFTYGVTVAFSGLMAVLMFIFSNHVAGSLLHNISLAPLLRGLSILIVFNSITFSQIGILSGFGRFKQIARINSLSGIFMLVTSVCLTYFFGLSGALYALLLVQVLNAALNDREIRLSLPKKRFKVSEPALRRDILRTSLPVAIQEVIYSLSTWLAVLLLVRMTTYGELGLYSAAMQWNAIILFIPGIMRNVILAHLSEISHDNADHNTILKRVLIINFISALVPCVIIFLFSDIIASSYGATYVGLSALISWAVFETLFSSVGNVYSQAYLSINKQKVVTMMRIGRDAGFLLLFVMLSRAEILTGAKALIAAGVISHAVFLLFASLLYHKIRS